MLCKYKLLYQLIFHLTRFSHRRHSGAKTNQKKKKLANVETASDPILGEYLHKLWYLATHMEWYVASQKTIRKSVREQILILNFIFNFNV